MKKKGYYVYLTTNLISMYGEKRPDVAEKNKTGWNKGIGFTDDHKRKIVEKNKGIDNGMYGIEPWNKGLKKDKVNV